MKRIPSTWMTRMRTSDGEGENTEDDEDEDTVDDEKVQELLLSDLVEGRRA